MAHGRRRVAVFAAACAGALVAASCASNHPEAARATVVSSAPTTTTLPLPPTTVAGARRVQGPDWTVRADRPVYRPHGNGRRLAAPVRLDIDAIGVHSSLVALGLAADGTMQTPADVNEAGWYAFAATPGTVGPAVIAGHVDSYTGPAVFYRLHDLRPGNRVIITHADGSRTTFVVTALQPFAKAAFPTAAVFGATPEPSLRLVTCSGVFDRRRGHYVDDLVVFASLER